jgi:hypothetical protein
LLCVTNDIFSEWIASKEQYFVAVIDNGTEIVNVSIYLLFTCTVYARGNYDKSNVTGFPYAS